jgi:aspartyl-tRNA(Asn)/glutamyl-tRNA(Gln) amidotransferase subunit A
MEDGLTLGWQDGEVDMTDVEMIANRTGAGMALAYRSGESTPAEIVECLLARIEASRGDNIFITVMAERARAEAKAATERYIAGRPLSALDGVPVAWKDLIDISGAPTTAGSRFFSGGPVKTVDLACAANATAAGMVTMGKLNMTEMAYSGLGLNPHFGTPLNPNDRKTPRSPGGSSSGSGAAVAAKLVPCAIGTDTGGSVRIPSAFNGVVGYKTSCGRIDTNGMFPLARTYDTIGPLARSVEDCVLLDQALRGAISVELLRSDPRELSLLYPTNVVMTDVQPAVAANFERSLEALARNGLSIRHERIDILDEILEMNARHGTLTAAEAYFEYQELIDSEDVKQIDRRVVKRIIDGKRMTAFDLLSIQRSRQAMIPKLTRQLRGAILVMPTSPITAPEVAPLEKSDELFHKVNLLTLRNTMLGNILDLCGVAMPNGTAGDGMPTSILFSAPHGEDERLLSAAAALEPIVAGAS